MGPIVIPVGGTERCLEHPVWSGLSGADACGANSAENKNRSGDGRAAAGSSSVVVGAPDPSDGRVGGRRSRLRLVLGAVSLGRPGRVHRKRL